MGLLNSKVKKIDLEEVASVQARLPACNACGERYGKHSCSYSEYSEDWLHSWMCLGCGQEIGPETLDIIKIALSAYWLIMN